MSRILFLLFIVFLPSVVSAQTLMRDVFAQLPDTILPLLTKNNRLDCIDFIENNMEARVKNKFDEQVILEALSDNYLRIQVSANSSVEMKLFGHINDTLICVNRVYKGPVEDSEVRVYSMQWSMLYKMQRPEVEQFLIKSDSAELNSDTMAIIREESEYLPLIKASLSPDTESITWTLQSGEFTKPIKKVAEKYLQPVVVGLTDSIPMPQD